jgi:hypothetical protein
MTQPNETPRAPRTDSDRRGNDRRNVERRAPLPAWRRPWAYVAYGVLAGLVAVLVMGRMRAGEERPPSNDAPMVARGPGAPQVAPAPEAPSGGQAPTPPSGTTQEAFGAAGFERLVLEGPAAVGRTVKAELFCEQPSSYQVRTGVQAEAVVAALTSNGRIPAAECKWGGANDPRREDFLLLVPPAMADDFAAAPVTSDEFQRRRRMVVNVEWVGRSEALALRTAGVFRGLAR